MFSSFRQYLVEIESKFCFLDFYILFYLRMQCCVRVGASKFQGLFRSGSRDTTCRWFISIFGLAQLVCFVCQPLSAYYASYPSKRKNKAIHQQPPIGCGLPGPYGGSSGIRESTSADISTYRRMSPLAFKKSPRLTPPVPSDDGSRKPARPHVVRCRGCIIRMAKIAWWYGMFQYIRSVRVEYVARIL